MSAEDGRKPLGSRGYASNPDGSSQRSPDPLDELHSRSQPFGFAPPMKNIASALGTCNFLPQIRPLSDRGSKNRVGIYVLRPAHLCSRITLSQVCALMSALLICSEIQTFA